LRRSAELAACWKEGERVRTPHLELAWRLRRVGGPRAAIVVPRYHYSAVARNRLRRRLREIVRREVLPALGPVDLVVRAKRDAYAAPFAVLRGELSAAARRVA
jgi:ribonuclease P protein component